MLFESERREESEPAGEWGRSRAEHTLRYARNHQARMRLTDSRLLEREAACMAMLD